MGDGDGTEGDVMKSGRPERKKKPRETKRVRASRLELFTITELPGVG
jgi:hypothetical protein